MKPEHAKPTRKQFLPGLAASKFGRFARTTVVMGGLATQVAACGPAMQYYEPYTTPGSDYKSFGTRVGEPYPQYVREIGCHKGRVLHTWRDGTPRGIESGPFGTERWHIVSADGTRIGDCPDPDRGFDAPWVKTDTICVYYRPGTNEIYKQRQCGNVLRAPIYPVYR